MQEKKRYILVSVECEGPLSKPQASKLVSAAMLEGVGELGASKAKAFLKEYDEQKKRGIVKCQTSMLEEVKACLGLKTVFEGGQCAIRTHKVSGAICNVWDGKREAK